MISKQDYIELSLINEVHDNLVSILCRSGATNLTCCPECSIDDFIHVEGCSIDEEVKVKSAMG